MEPQVDPAPCLAAISGADDDRIVTVCGTLIDNDKTAKADRVKALIGRAAVFGRRDQIDRAIADYDGVLSADASLADIYNARGELWRRKGDRPRALRDFGAAIKLNPDQQAARANYKSLALELERIGAMMAVAGKPSFNCATARKPVEKAICADPELANLDREINAVNSKVVRDATAESPTSRACAATRAGRVHRPPRCIVRPRRLRSAESHARSAGSSVGSRAALAEEAGVFGLNPRSFA